MSLQIKDYESIPLKSKFWINDPNIPEGPLSNIPEIVSLLAVTINYETPILTTFGNVTGSMKMCGGIVAKDGKVYGSPAWSSALRVVNPITREIETIVITSSTTDSRWSGAVYAENDIMYGILSASAHQMEFNTLTKESYFRSLLSGDNKFFGGVIKNNKIFAIPQTYSKVFEFDIASNTVVTFGSLGTTGNKWSGGVLHPNGKIYGIPYSGPSVLEITPETRETRLIGNISGVEKWRSGCLAPNGKIYCMPCSAAQILEFDPETEELNLIGNFGSSANKWVGSILAPNGRIYGIPSMHTSVIEFDPITKTSQLLGSFGTTSTHKWLGGVLAPNGKIYGIPAYSTTFLEIDTLHIPKDPTICTHPYFNKL